MWETIGEVLTSGNGIAIGVLIVIIVILVIIGIKKGLFSWHGDNLTIGREASEKERSIIRNQIDWAKLACQAFETQVPRFEGYNEFKGKFIIEKAYDEIIRWIAFNHIESTKSYISIKQEIIWNIVLKYTAAKDITSPKFRKMTNEYVEYIIDNLIKIRDEYQ